MLFFVPGQRGFLVFSQQLNFLHHKTFPSQVACMDSDRESHGRDKRQIYLMEGLVFKVFSWAILPSGHDRLNFFLSGVVLQLSIQSFPSMIGSLFHTNLNASVWHHGPSGERRQVIIMPLG
jgi:hypothetical protein